MVDRILAVMQYACASFINLQNSLKVGKEISSCTLINQSAEGGVVMSLSDSDSRFAEQNSDLVLF